QRSIHWAKRSRIDSAFHSLSVVPTSSSSPKPSRRADLFSATTKQRLLHELGTALNRGPAGPLDRVRCQLPTASGLCHFSPKLLPAMTARSAAKSLAILSANEVLPHPSHASNVRVFIKWPARARTGAAARGAAGTPPPARRSRGATSFPIPPR